MRMGSQRGAGALAQAKELASGGRIRAQERSTTEGVDGSEREPQNQGWLLDLGFDGWTVGRRGQLVRRGGWRERRTWGRGKLCRQCTGDTCSSSSVERVTWARGRPRPQAGTALLPRSSLPASSQAVWAGAPLGPGLGFHLSASWTKPFQLTGLGGGGRLLHSVQRGLKAQPQSLGWTDQKEPFWGTLAYLCLWLSPGYHYHASCPAGLTSYCEVAVSPYVSGSGCPGQWK